VAVLNALKGELAVALGEPPVAPKPSKAAGATPPSSGKAKGAKGKGGGGSGGASGDASGDVVVPLREVRAGRIEKVEAMRAAGMNPFEYGFQSTHTAAELATQYAHLENGAEAAEAQVKLAGRVLTRRSFGKLMFFTCQDESGTFQLYVEKAKLGPEAFEQLKVRACVLLLLVKLLSWFVR
jgi:lysyl-tRNA synthetase class 2